VEEKQCWSIKLWKTFDWNSLLVIKSSKILLQKSAKLGVYIKKNTKGFLLISCLPQWNEHMIR
jgi:hypothetical protein